MHKKTLCCVLILKEASNPHSLKRSSLNYIILFRIMQF